MSKTKEERIKKALDELQRHMESNHHLQHSWISYELLNTAEKLFPLMTEEDKEYVKCARLAVQDQLKWNV